jgi:acyl-coenzyme A thioesterase 9
MLRRRIALKFLSPNQAQRVVAVKEEVSGSKICRFMSKAEYESWSNRVVNSKKELCASKIVNVTNPKSLAPFLCDVNPLAEQRLKFHRCDGAIIGTPSYSTVETTWPISSDPILARDVGDVQGWSAIRLGKFFETLDALTADSAYMHTDGHAKGLALVTAGHYFSRKLTRTFPDVDFSMRCYPTAVGNSSIEIRTDAIQNNKLVNYCHTIMVCVDRTTLRPVKGMMPPLVNDPTDNGQEERSKLADLHTQVRKHRAESSISLYSRKLSAPPNDIEMRNIHALHRQATLHSSSFSTIENVSDHSHSNAFIVFPEQRNVHGKTFGGYVVSQAFDSAYVAATRYLKGRPFAAVGMDEAIFLQPIGIGDLIDFHCRVIHSDPATGVFRVSVYVTVLDKQDPTREKIMRTNYLRFIFAAEPKSIPLVLPSSYSEILGYVNAERRHIVEPVSTRSLSDISEFLAESSAANKESTS